MMKVLSCFAWSRFYTLLMSFSWVVTWRAARLLTRFWDFSMFGALIRVG